LTDPLRLRSAYARALVGKRDPILDGILRNALLEKRFPPIQIDDGAGRILQMLTMLHKPVLVVEIGSLFGYSTIYIARGLSPGARLIAIDSDAVAAEATASNLAVAGLSDRVEVVMEDAISWMKRLPRDSVDMVFIDGDKEAYPAYFSAIAGKLRSGAIIVADDAFAAGPYASNSDEEAERQRRGILLYNKAVTGAEEFFTAVVPTETGLMVSIKS
jgi:caffeoyl-CoA O-methyltransferase